MEKEKKQKEQEEEDEGERDEERKCVEYNGSTEHRPAQVLHGVWLWKGPGIPGMSVYNFY